MKVPYIDLARQHAGIKAELLDAVAAVIDHGQFVLGQEVARFEAAFAELCSVPHAVGVNSGTDAILIGLRLLDVGPGDEVIVPANSFVASASAVALLGARPVLVDARDDLNVDPAAVERAVTPRTKAVMVVHLTGRPARMDAIGPIARRHCLKIIEDAAQAVGAELNGQRVGSFGDVGCFSLHPLKTLNACGDGGVLTVRDPALRDRALVLRNIGLRTRDDAVEWSGNSRLDTIQAAMLLVKLKYLERWNERRRAIAARYCAALRDVVTVPEDGPGERGVYHTFVVQTDRRDELKAFLAERGVGSAIHYPTPIHLTTIGRTLGYGPRAFPRAEAQADRILSLPVHQDLTDDEVDYVAEQIRAFCRQRSPVVA